MYRFWWDVNFAIFLTVLICMMLVAAIIVSIDDSPTNDQYAREAQARADEQIAIARQQEALTAQAEAQARGMASQAWAAVSPWIVGILAVTIICMALVVFRFRTMDTDRMVAQSMLLDAQTRQNIIDHKLENFAARTGATVVQTSTGYRIIQDGKSFDLKPKRIEHRG
jgi:hypothetical protein